MRQTEKENLSVLSTTFWRGFSRPPSTPILTNRKLNIRKVNIIFHPSTFANFLVQWKADGTSSWWKVFGWPPDRNANIFHSFTYLFFIQCELATCLECSCCPEAAVWWRTGWIWGAGMWWSLLTLFIVCIWSHSHLATCRMIAVPGESAKKCVLFCSACSCLLFTWKPLKKDRYKNGARTGSRVERLKKPAGSIVWMHRGVFSAILGMQTENYSQLQPIECSRGPYISVEEHRVRVKVEEHIGMAPNQLLVEATPLCHCSTAKVWSSSGSGPLAPETAFRPNLCPCLCKASSSNCWRMI